MSFNSTSTACRSSRRRRSRMRSARSSGRAPTPDGRFLLWSGSNVAAWAPISRQPVRHRRPAAGHAACRQRRVLDVPLTVHPSEMRAFLQLSLVGPVTVAEPGHTRTLPPPPCAAPVLESRSGDGRRLSYYCDVRAERDGGRQRRWPAARHGPPRRERVHSRRDHPHARRRRGTTCSRPIGTGTAYQTTRCCTDASTSPPARCSQNGEDRPSVVHAVWGVQRGDRSPVCRDPGRHSRHRRKHPDRDRLDRRPGPPQP